MDASFIPIEVVPSKTPFGLDQLRRSYKTSLSAADAIAACPAVGTADETFEFMFLMPIGTPESAESATRVDLVYQGCLADDGEGNPTLPAIKHNTDSPVQSATSRTSSIIWPDLATIPTSTTYRSHSSSISLISNEDTSDEVCPDPDPVVADDVISWDLGAANSYTFDEIADLIIGTIFIQKITETVTSDEIVPGQYWQITKSKVVNLYPYAPTS